MYSILPNIKLCRLCLCGGGTLMDVFKENEFVDFVVHDVIEDLLHIEIKKQETIPWLICASCLGKLIEFRYFKIRCLECKFTFETRYLELEKPPGDPLDFNSSALSSDHNWYGGSSRNISKEDIKREDSEDCRSDDVEFVGEVGGGGGGDGEDSSGEKCVGELVFLTRESGSGEALGERCLIRTVGPTAHPIDRRGMAEDCVAGVQLSSAAHQTASNGIPLATHSSVPSAPGPHGQPPPPPCVPTVPSMPTVPPLPPFVPPTVPRIRRRNKKPQGGSNSGRCAKCERGCCDLNHGSDDEDDVWLSGPKRKRAALQRWYWELEKLRNKTEQEKNTADGGMPSRVNVDDSESELEEENRKDDHKGTSAAPKPRKKKKQAASSAEGQWQGGMPKIVNVASAVQALSQVSKRPKKGTPSASHVGTATAASPGEKCVKTSRLAYESSTGISLVGKVGNTVCVKVSGDGAGGRSGALIKVLKKINEEGKLKKIGSVSPQGRVGEAVRGAGTAVGPKDRNPNGDGGGMAGNVGSKTGGPGGSGTMAPDGSAAAALPGTNVGNQRVVMVMKRTKGSESGDAEYKVACGLSRELVNVSLEFVPESEKGIGDDAKSATSGENGPPPVETIDLTTSGEDRARSVETMDLTSGSRVDSNVGFRDNKVSVGSGNAGSSASIKDKMTATLKGYLKKVPEVLKTEECGFASKRINPVDAIHAESKDVPPRTIPENSNVGNEEEKCCRKVGNGSGSSGSKDQRAHLGLESGPGRGNVAVTSPSKVAVAGPSLGSGRGEVFGGTFGNSREDPSVSSNSFGATSILAGTKLGSTGNGSSTLELSDQTSNISGRRTTVVKSEECEPDAGSGRIPSAQDCEASTSSNDTLEKCVKVEGDVDSACGSEMGTVPASEKRKRGRPRKGGSKEGAEGEDAVAAASGTPTGEVVGKKRGRPRGLPDGYKRSLDRQIDVFAGKLVYRSTRGRLVQQAKDTAPVYVEASGRILKDAPRRRRKKPPPEPEAKAQETRWAAGKMSPWSGERSCDTDSSEDVWEREWDKLEREQPIRPSTGGCGLTRADMGAGLGSKCGATSKREGAASASEDGGGPSFSAEPVGSFSAFAGLISPDGIKKEVEDDGADAEGSTASGGAAEGSASVLRANGVRAVGGASAGSSLCDERMGGSELRGVVGTDERLAFEKIACKVEEGDSEVDDVVAGAAVERFGSFPARSPVHEEMSGRSSRATTMAAERCFAESEGEEMNVKTESPSEGHNGAGVDFETVRLFSTSSSLSYDGEVDGSSASRTVWDNDGSVVPGFRTCEGGEGMGSSGEYHSRASASVVEARSYCVSSFEGDGMREHGCGASKTVTNIDRKRDQGKESGVCDGEGCLPSGDAEGATRCSEEGTKAPEENYGTFAAAGRSTTRSNAGLPGRAANENDEKEEADQP